MYDELVKRLREEGEYSDLVAYMHGIRPISPEDVTAKIARSWKELFAKAADAIEDLQKQVEDYECRLEISPEAEYAIDKHCDDIISRMDKLIKGLDDKPRWIPVTERLPAESKHYLAVINGTVGEAAFYAPAGQWTDPMEEWENWSRFVTHWMPLPEPPREET